MGYCSFYGKKLDPEPGRCRRTDGKKWRCSKEAYPGSKYCERHMHRGRNRSRKPVETHTLLQNPQSSSSSFPSTASSVTSLSLADGATCGSRNVVNSSGGSIPLHSLVKAHNQSTCSGVNSQQLQLDHPISYSSISPSPKDYRHLQGFRSGMDQHSYFSGASRSEKELGMDSSLDSTWNPMPSGPSYSLSKYGNDLDLSKNYVQLNSLSDLKQNSLISLASQQNYHGGHFSSNVSPKEENQSIRTFLDQGPRTRDSWYDFDKEKSHQSSCSTTHLSISIPMASSDFSTTSSRSANDE